jgi:hypothetical protein
MRAAWRRNKITITPVAAVYVACALVLFIEGFTIRADGGDPCRRGRVVAPTADRAGHDQRQGLGLGILLRLVLAATGRVSGQGMDHQRQRSAVLVLLALSLFALAAWRVRSR